MQSLRRWSLGAALSLGPAALALFFVGGAFRSDRVPTFRDQSDFFFPSHVYTASRLRAGSLPLWNPLPGNGESWIGDGQNEIFYLPAGAFLLRNAAVATGAFLLLHFLLADLFFLGFLRSRSLSRPSAILGSAVFAFSGGMVSLSAYWNHFAGLAWVPAMAWAAQLGLTTRRQRAAFAFSLAAAVLAGSPEMALFGVLLSAAVFLFEWRREGREQLETGRVRFRAWKGFVSAAASGALLGAVQVLPIFDVLLRANRRSSVWTGPITLRGIAGSILAPSLSSSPWLPAGAGYLQSIYVSLPVVLLAAAAVRSPERRRENGAWAFLGIVALAAAMLPIDGPFRYPSKLFALTLFALALLAAEGLEVFRFSLRGRPGAFAGFLALASGALAFFVLSPAPAERAAAAGFAVFLALTAWDPSPSRSGFAAVLASLFAAAHLVFASMPLRRTVSLSTLLARPLPSRGKVLTSEDEILSNWSNHALPDEASRVRRQIDSLSGYTNLLFGVSKARTATALPARSQQLFAESLVGVQDFLPAAAIAGCGEVRFPRGEKMARVLVPEPLSGATFFFRDRAGSDPLTVLREISSGNVDYRRVVTIEPARGGGRVRRDAGLRDPADLADVALASTLSQTPERIEYAVTLSRDAWLYLPMSWDPWWRASIDGRDSSVERANGVFSAVFVPRGEHRVVWRYRPWPFYAGAAISGLAVLALLLGLLSGDRPR